ncbi:MAG: hypothetical protein WDO24_00115 [Pseudomonadota bacterium]
MPITRLRGIYARHGMWGALGLIPHNARMALRSWSPKRRRARRQELAFDRRHGIDTMTPAALSTLGVSGASLRHAVEYKPSGIDFVRAMIGASRHRVRRLRLRRSRLGQGPRFTARLASAVPAHHRRRVLRQADRDRARQHRRLPPA